MEKHNHSYRQQFERAIQLLFTHTNAALFIESDKATKKKWQASCSRRKGIIIFPLLNLPEKGVATAEPESTRLLWRIIFLGVSCTEKVWLLSNGTAPANENFSVCECRKTCRPLANTKCSQRHAFAIIKKAEYEEGPVSGIYEQTTGRGKINKSFRAQG